MSAYDPQRDPVRIVGRALRWTLKWVALPVLLGVFLSGNVDARAMPVFGPERITAVLLLDGQAYFGHLDDSGESGMLVLHDVYYLQDARGATTGLPVSLVARGSEAHEPVDGMRINRDRVLALERVRPESAVARAIDAERALRGASAPLVSLNRAAAPSPDVVAAQRMATEQGIQRGLTAALAQLAKLNDLVLPISKAEAQTITQKAQADLRAVRRSALAALASALGMSPADGEAYVRATDGQLEASAFTSDAGVLLAPDLARIVSTANTLYAQTGDAAAKQLTQPRTTASPTPSATPTPPPSPSPTTRP